MVVDLVVDVNGSPSEVLSARWRALSITLTDDDSEDVAVLALSAAGADLELPPRSASLRFSVNGVDLGSYEAHKLSGSSRSGTVTIRAGSLSPDSAARTQRDGAWEAQRVGDVVAAIAGRAGLLSSIEPAIGNREVPPALQAGESDLAFARRLVAAVGGRLLIQDGRLIVSRGDRARADLPALEIDLEADGTWVDWDLDWRRSVGVVRAAYAAADGASVESVDVGSGSGQVARVLPAAFPDRGAAMAAASALLSEEGAERDGATLVTGLLPEANVLQPVRFVRGGRAPRGLPALVVRQVRHVIGRRAATTTLACAGEAADPGTFTVSPPPAAGAGPQLPGPGIAAPPGGGTPGPAADTPIVGELSSLDDVTWLHTDVSGWAQASAITGVSIRDVPRGGICINHTKAAAWPGTITAGGPNIAGNPWVFVQLGGKWYGATWEWLRPGQRCKLQAQGHAAPSVELAPHIKVPPLNRWTPRSGDLVGFMVSTPARAGAQGPVRERSNVVLVRWP